MFNNHTFFRILTESEIDAHLSAIAERDIWIWKYPASHHLECFLILNRLSYRIKFKQVIVGCMVSLKFEGNYLVWVGGIGSTQMVT